MNRTAFLLITFLLSTQAALSQQSMVDTLREKFNDYRVKSLQEKIYAHLDRNFYLTGESMWFKLYVTDGSFHKPLDVSKVAYVEILDKGNLSVLQAKVELSGGTGSGSFFLPASLSSGNYKLRVYTNWMKNFSPEFYFHQYITIVNPFLKLESNRDTVFTASSVAFFPEGGDLLADVNSKIGFRITDAEGKGMHAEGHVLNENKDTVASFAPTKFGIGHFMLTPSTEARYKVVIKDATGKTTEHRFPQVHASGYGLQLTDAGEQVRVTVTAKGVTSRYVYLFVHARQIISKSLMQFVDNNMAVFMLDKKDLPEGVSHFTVFDAALSPLCERLYFTYPDKNLDIELESNQREYSYRKRVAVTIETKDTSGKPTAANLSLSAYKIDSLGPVGKANIFHYLWLKSDLAGNVESPEYYFDSAHPEAAKAMDNLMLTHGWRRFDWREVLQPSSQKRYLPEHNGHIIKGLVSDNTGPQSRVMTYLGSPGKIVRAYGSRSNYLGEVHFDIKDFYGPRRIIIQTLEDSVGNYSVNIVNPFSSSFEKQMVPSLKLQKKKDAALLSRSIAMQVQDIYYFEKFGNRFVDPVVDSSAFYGEADATYLLDDYTRFQVMEEVMREYVPGVLVRKRRDGFHFLMIDAVNGGILSGDPMILLDGVPLSDADKIMKIDPLVVKKLEVVKRQYFLGHAAFSGILSYSTYEGNLRGLELDPGTVSLNYEGLQLRRQFYSPQYRPQEKENRMPDQRYLLHWEPGIQTDENGKQEVEFYTSDVPGQYAVIVQGLNDDGLSGSRMYTFTVKPPENQ